jgi:hypothetical protein
MDAFWDLTGSPMDIFDYTVVINLARRPQRLERFWSLLGDWPFKRPQRFEGIDGSALKLPSGWDKGAGAWGCLLSHRAVLDDAINRGLSSLLVLEDDAYPVPDFARLAGQFLQNVPSDWDGLMFGAEHLLPPREISPGVVRCIASNRSHAYAVRGPFMKILSTFWKNTTNDHCDLVISSLMKHFKLYAPDPLLIGQDAGESDVTGRNERLRFLSAEHSEKIARADSRHCLEKIVVRVTVPRTARQSRAGPAL